MEYQRLDPLIVLEVMIAEKVIIVQELYLMETSSHLLTVASSAHRSP